MGFDSPGKPSSLHTTVEEDTSSISRPGLPGWLWNLWPVNWRAVTRQLAPGPPPGRLTERSTRGPKTHQSRARVVSHPKPVGRTHKAARHSAQLGPTPVRSGPVQSTVYWLAEPQGTSSEAGRNRHHTRGLGNLGRHERWGPPSSSMRQGDHPPAHEPQWRALRAQVSTSSLDGHATWWTTVTHAKRKEAAIHTRS